MSRIIDARTADADVLAKAIDRRQAEADELARIAADVQADADRAVRLVKRTAAFKGRCGDTPRPILVWHPSGYPEAADTNDAAVFNGLCEALRQMCAAGEKAGVDVAVELTRNGSLGSAEGFLRLKDRVASPALRAASPRCHPWA